MAVRFEDTAHEVITMNGEPFSVGVVPHSLRMRLMRQHMGDSTLNLTDMLNDDVYEGIWRKISTNNSSVYDQLDGEISMYRTKRIGDFKTALSRYELKSALDTNVQASLAEIKGFLVDWPQTLMGNEDLSPSIATRAVIPNELWV